MMSLDVGLKKTRLTLLEDYLVLLLCLGYPGLRWMFSDLDLLQEFWLFHLRLGIRIFHLSLASTLPFALSLRAWSSDASISSISSMSATVMSPFQILSRIQDITEECTWQDFWTKLMQSRLVFRRNGVIFDDCSKKYTWSVKGFSEPPFIRCLPIRQKILQYFADSSSIPWNPPTIHCPDLIATIPQMSILSLCATALSAIPFVSDLCGVDVQWFQDNSSQDLPNSKELSVPMTFGFLVGSRNFVRLFWVSWEVFVSHG